uniref:Uncharacterized protein n=1 Tax=Arundo donax TaxID=35708 RepID=A0A0A9F8U9_ARUDO
MQRLFRVQLQKTKYGRKSLCDFCVSGRPFSTHASVFG